MHERGRLERLSAALAPHVAGGQPAQLGVDERARAVSRASVSPPRACSMSCVIGAGGLGGHSVCIVGQFRAIPRRPTGCPVPTKAFSRTRNRSSIGVGRQPLPAHRHEGASLARFQPDRQPARNSLLEDRAAHLQAARSAGSRSRSREAPPGGDPIPRRSGRPAAARAPGSTPPATSRCGVPHHAATFIVRASNTFQGTRVDEHLDRRERTGRAWRLALILVIGASRARPARATTRPPIGRSPRATGLDSASSSASGLRAGRSRGRRARGPAGASSPQTATSRSARHSSPVVLGAIAEQLDQAPAGGVGDARARGMERNGWQKLKFLPKGYYM